MFVLRCTKKLLGRLPPGSGGQGDERASDTKLGDWTANLFFIGRQQIVLGVNNKTLVPVLLPIAPHKTFISRFVEAAGEMLMAIGIEDRKAVLVEMRAMNECIVAPTNDRRVLGTINDFGRALDFYVDGRPLPEVSLHVAETPCSLIGMERPRDVARAMFSDTKLRLNMVEIEIGVMVSQCLDRRIPTKPILVAEVAAWNRRRNREKARIKWLFTVERAREKLGRAYPVLPVVANQAAA